MWLVDYAHFYMIYVKPMCVYNTQYRNSSSHMLLKAHFTFHTSYYIQLFTHVIKCIIIIISGSGDDKKNIFQVNESSHNKQLLKPHTIHTSNWEVIQVGGEERKKHKWKKKKIIVWKILKWVKFWKINYTHTKKSDWKNLRDFIPKKPTSWLKVDDLNNIFPCDDNKRINYW